MNKIKLIVKQIILNFKYIISMPSNILLLAILFLLPYVIPIFFIPLYQSFSVLILMTVVIPTSIIYVSTTYSIREGTIYNNLKMTKNNKSYFYISSFICMIIYGIFSLFTTYFVLEVMEKLGLLMDGLVWYNITDKSRYVYLVFKIPFFPFLYSTLEAIVILFSICFFFQNIINTKKNMYILILSLLILTVIFGGALNNYFMGTKPDLINEGYRLPSFRAWLLPKGAYSISIFFPLFGPGQHLASIGGTFRWDNQMDTFYNLWDDQYVFFTWLTSKNSPSSELGRLAWNILWIAPFFWTCLFGSMGIAASKMRITNN